MQLHNKHFNAAPWSWNKVRPYLGRPVAGGRGGQGVILELDREFEGAVVKLYETPRSSPDLARVQALIRECRALSDAHPATASWFARLNLPLRPILSPDGRFGGVVLPPLPSQVRAKEFRYDATVSKFVRVPGHVLFEAQFVTRPSSPLGQTTDKWQWRLLSSLAETVALMHSVNLVHGDLSLTNVLATQANDTHLDDNVYLIDIDDAFLDNGKQAGAPAIRKSRPTYDPYSVKSGRVSKDTDVYVVALWAVAFMERRFVAPESITRTLPSMASSRLKLANVFLPDVVLASLGPIGSRPAMIELYTEIRDGARQMGALR